MSSLNKVQIIGNLCNDPELRSMQNGGKVCNMTVATNDRWKDKGTGEMRERAEYHRVVVFDEKIAEVCEKYLKKGAKVYLEGALQTRKWQDQSGNDRYSTEVVLQRFRGNLVMLGDGKSPDDPANYGGATGGGSSAPPPGGLDDKVPF